MDAVEAAWLESVGDVHIEIGIAIETSATVGDEEFQMWIQRREDLQVPHRNPLLRGTVRHVYHDIHPQPGNRPRTAVSSAESSEDDGDEHEP